MEKEEMYFSLLTIFSVLHKVLKCQSFRKNAFCAGYQPTLEMGTMQKITSTKMALILCKAVYVPADI